jgi:hypothetical protein
MRSDVVVIASISSQDAAQMRLAQDDKMIHTLAPDRSDQPFGEAILPRRGRRDGLVPDAHRTHSACDNAAVNPVPIADGGLMVLREKALRGDARALDRFIDLAVRFNNAAAEIAPAQTLNADDQAILTAYVAQFAGAATTSAMGRPADDPATKRAAGSATKARK